MTQTFFDIVPDIMGIEFDPQFINRYFQLFDFDVEGELTLENVHIL